MKSLRVLPLLLSGLVASAVAKTVTTGYTPNGPVTFTNAGSLSTFTHTCGQTSYLVASTSVDGATIDFPFTGTGISLTLLTDADRGKYTIFLDGAAVTTASGITSGQTCTTIYTVNGLTNGAHTFSLRTNTQTYGTSGTSAKVEFINFDVTVPDSTPTPTQALGQAQSNSDALSGGTIAAIIIACLLVLIVFLLGFLLYRAHRQIVQLSAQPQSPPLFAPHSGPYSPHSTSPGMSMYAGHPEVMARTPTTPPMNMQPRPPSSPASAPYTYYSK